MSEHLRSGNEKLTEAIDLSVESKKNLESLQKKAAQEKEHSHETVKELEKAAEQKAVSGKELSVGDKAEGANQATPIGLQKELKDAAYKQTMTKVRRRLPKRQRALSKVIHQPAVQAISEASAKTVARPSGLLIGGFCAFIGSGLLLLASRHYGFTYNFTIFLLLIIGGYIAGLLIELVVRSVRHRQ